MAITNGLKMIYDDIRASVNAHTGKPDPMITMTINAPKTKAASAWIVGRTEHNENYVFVTMVGTALDRDNIGRYLRSYQKKAGLSSRGVHTLRHTFATNGV